MLAFERFSSCVLNDSHPFKTGFAFQSIRGKVIIVANALIDMPYMQGAVICFEI
jgi:hypothetical protein